MKFKVAYIYDVIGDNEALIVRNDKGINSLEDLKGRSVAAPFGSTTHYHLIVALKTRGIEPESVTLLDMPNPDILTAWKRGDLDAAFVWDPTRQQMLDSGGSVLISSRQLAEEGYLTADLCLVHNAFATQYPELVTRYVAVQNRAVEFCRSHPNEAAAAIARQFSITPEEALAQMNNLVLLNGAEQAAPDYIGTPNAPGHIAEVLKDTADFMVQQKSIRSAPGLEKFKQAVEPSFVNRALE
jgi:taurine transport system substrate-binding protein